MRQASFKDHFSRQADQYAIYRPHYPDELFAYLASLVRRHDLALDCATGNGQAAGNLALYFRQVVAVDASEQQIANAQRRKNIAYLVASAEHLPVEAHSIDVLTIAQALHWLNFDLFYAEVRRVVKPDGVFAAWTYGWTHISPEIDPIMRRYETEIIGPYWPPERRYVDEGYFTIPFPFPELAPPIMEMSKKWTLPQFLGYLGTWSGTRGYIDTFHEDPVEKIHRQLTKAWGNPNRTRTIRWPFYFRIGRL